MSHFLTEDQILMRNVAREFAQKEVEPRAIDIDKKDEFPEDLVKKAADLNFFGLMIPEQYGGLGSDLTTTCVVLEEIAKASPALAGLLSVEIVLCPIIMNALGTEAQKQKYLTPMTKGHNLMALSSTEPAGTANIGEWQTTLTEDGDAYRLNGLKIFCTQGSASVYMVVSKTQGIAIVEKGMPGFEVGKFEDKLGWHGSNTGTLLFKDVLIPKENILGGQLSADSSLGSLAGQLGHSASSLGCAEGIYAKTLAYVQERNLYGQSMTALQPITYWLSDIYTKIEACRALLYTATRQFDEGQIDPLMGYTCKVFICETAVQIANTCLQMWGGHGIMNDVGINRYLRDARTNTIAEGSSEIMLWVIGMSTVG